jgi:PilZ domain
MERFSALVLSQDGDTLRVISKALDEYGLLGDIARSVGDANELLKGRRFDLAVCDYDLPDAQHLDPGSSWRGMVFALIPQGRLAKAHKQRIHLTLPKPLTQVVFSKGLRAAYTTMAHERRAALRHPVEAMASWAEIIYRGEQRELNSARVINVSRTGMALATKELLKQQATVHATFELPENGGQINVEGDVVWAKAPGHSGIRFTRLPAASQKKLTEWLDAKLPPEFM